MPFLNYAPNKIKKMSKKYEQTSAEVDKALRIDSISCRFCSNLQMALTGDSNVEDFDQTLFNDIRPQVELFCGHPFTPEIFWNERIGNDPEIMLDKFSCRYFKSNGKNLS